MRKRSPNAVIDQFQDELNRSKSDWSTLTSAVPGGGAARRASMDAFNRAAVAFERFRSDWHIAAITRDATSFAKSQERRVHESLKLSGHSCLIPYTQVVLPKHPTLAQVADLLDVSGGNLSIPNIVGWKNLAHRHLSDPWGAKVDGLSWELGTATQAVIAIRNAAAHQSPQSFAAMSKALNALTHHLHTGLRRPVNSVSLTGIPAYLHGSIGPCTRVERYHDLLVQFSDQLRTP